MMLPDPPVDLSELTGSMNRIDVSGHTGLVVVLPHPDDESFAAGGLISLFRDAGKPATYVCGTWGDGGRRMGSPNFATRESLRDIRESELDEACAILGCELRMLGLRDKTVEFEDPAHVALLVRNILEELRPSLVVSFYPGYGVHPDHDALGEATRLAVRDMRPAERPKLLTVAVGDRKAIVEKLGEPDEFADIRAVGQRKLDALKAHRSQTQAMFQHMEQDSSQMTDQEREFRRQSFQIERFYILDPD